MDRLNFERLIFFCLRSSSKGMGRPPHLHDAAACVRTRARPSVGSWRCESNTGPVQITIVASQRPMLLLTALSNPRRCRLLDADWSSDDVLLGSALYALRDCTSRGE